MAKLPVVLPLGNPKSRPEPVDNPVAAAAPPPWPKGESFLQPNNPRYGFMDFLSDRVVLSLASVIE